MPLSVQPSTDAATIHAILTDPWVVARIRHDEREPGYIAHEAVTYWLATVGSETAGVFIEIGHGAHDVEVHAALLRPFVRQGRDLGRLFLSRLWARPDLSHVTAPVLSTLPSAANWCRRLGFTLEGRKRQCCRVDGVPADVLLFGMVRSEWLASSENMR